MSKLLDKISKDLNAVGHKKRSIAARAWLKSKIPEFGKISRTRDIMGNPTGISRPIIGSMFFFYYDAKLKDELPYWDRFPLVLPIELYSDSFLGLNFHYLPLNMRIALLDKLYDLTNNDKFDASTKIRASYGFLSKAARYKEFQPCLKKYLGTHIQSRMVMIEPDHWDTAIFLPVEQFVGASSRQVWSDSREQV